MFHGIAVAGMVQHGQSRCCGNPEPGSGIWNHVLTYTKPSWFHWEPSQNKAQLSGMDERHWALVWKVHSTVQEGIPHRGTQG